MSERKYKRGRQICSMADFAQSESNFFIVYFGCTNPQTKHKSFLISWPYRIVDNFIQRGWIFEADKIEEEGESNGTNH